MDKSMILLVDDEPSIRELLEEFLTGEGYQISTAPNGKKAFEMIKVNTFDLVVSDIRMPEMTGFDLVKRVKRYNQKIGFILMTGFSTVYTESDVRKVGADDYIPKPVDLSVLLEKIERVIFQMKLLMPKDM